MKLRCAFLLLGVLSPTVTHANGRPAATSTVTVDPIGNNKILVGATFGALFSDDGGQTWRLACEGPLGTAGVQIDPVYRITTNCVIVVAAPSGVLYSRDGGCSWTHAGGSVAGASADDVALHPTDAGRVLIVTNTPSQPNAIHLSNDGGMTFAATNGTAPAGTVFRNVRYAADGMHAYAITTDGSITHVYASTDGGQHWMQTPYASSLESGPVLIGADPRDASKVYYYARANGVHRLHRSTDGGVTWNDVTSDISSIFAGLFTPSGTLYLATNSGIRKSVDGISIGPPATSSEIVVTCLALQGSTLYGCAQDSTDGFALGKSTDDGASWMPLLKLNMNIVGPQICATGTDVCTQCYAMWPTFAMQFGLPNQTQPDCMTSGSSFAVCGNAGSGGTGGSGGSKGGGGCSCSVGTLAVPSWFGILPLAALAAALWRRRRR